MKLMERSREDRYPNADTALCALRNWQASEATGAASAPSVGQEPIQGRTAVRQPILSRGSAPVAAVTPASSRSVPGPADGDIGSDAPKRVITGAVAPRVANARTTGIIHGARPATGAVRTTSTRIRPHTSRIADHEDQQPEVIDRRLGFKLLLLGGSVLAFLGLLILLYFIYRAINPATALNRTGERSGLVCLHSPVDHNHLQQEQLFYRATR
jgi:hypothetical protein